MKTKRSGLLGFAFVIFAASAIANPIPSNRLINWGNNSGVPGGIPARTTIFTNIAAGASTAIIQAALNNCPSNQVVQLSAGTYNITSQLWMGRNGVTLRGAGMGATILSATASPGLIPIHMEGFSWYQDYANPDTNRHRAWVGGLSQYSTNITLSPDTGDLQVGAILALDQLNDTNTTALGVGAPLLDGGTWTSVAYPTTGADRQQFQLTRVTAISNNVVTISPYVYMPNYRTDLLPEAWWFGTYGQQPICFSGIEDLSVICYQAQSGVQIQSAYACWTKNIEVTGCQRYIYPLITVRFQGEHCYLHGPPTSDDDYAFNLVMDSGALIQNNIGNACDSFIIIAGVQGSVFSYNYCTNAGAWMKGFYMPAGMWVHGAHPCMNLFEGNLTPGIFLDNYWGSSAYNVLFRNRITGCEEAHSNVITGDIQAIADFATNRYATFACNVLGTPGYTAVYQVTNNATCINDQPRVFYINPFQSTCGSATDQQDPFDFQSMFRAVNWDCVNNSVVAEGYLESDFPASLYLTNKPSWFGNLAWPAVSPGNPTYSMSRTNIPSGYRFILGTDPSNGTNPPSIATQPLGVTNSTTAGFSISVLAYGDGVLAYQWCRSGTNLPGASQSSYSQVPATTSQSGSYSCVITNSYGAITSAFASVLITNVGVPPSITIQPSGTTNSTTAGFALSVTATGDPTLAYQWLGSGSILSGATASTYSQVPATTAQSGNYSCIVTNSFGSVTSLPASVLITNPGIAPSITVQPVGATNSASGGFKLQITAAGDPTLFYQWKKSGVSVAGATKRAYTQSPATASQSGNYACVVTNRSGSVTSATVAVLITNIPPSITAQPSSVTSSTTLGFSLSVRAAGDPILAYQWFQDGASISGATSSGYSQVPATTGQSGNYTCVVTNQYGSVTSDIAAVTITNAPPPPPVNLRVIGVGGSIGKGSL